jgi:hypothetical protein
MAEKYIHLLKGNRNKIIKAMKEPHFKGCEEIVDEYFGTGKISTSQYIEIMKMQPEVIATFLFNVTVGMIYTAREDYARRIIYWTFMKQLEHTEASHFNTSLRKYLAVGKPSKGECMKTL